MLVEHCTKKLDLLAEICMIEIMILSHTTIAYFSSIAAKVIKGMAQFNRRIPYPIEDERILQGYEAIRAVWMDGDPVSRACQIYDLPRSSYYKLEQRFVDFGFCGFSSTAIG